MGKVPFFQMERDAVKELPTEKVFGYFLFGQPQFIINDADLAKRVLIKDFEHFSDLREFDQNSKIADLFLTSLKGDEWKKMRSMMSGVFTSGKLKLMAKHIAKVGLNFEEHVSKLAEKGDDCCMKELGSLITLDGLASAGYGVETNSFKDLNNEFRVKAMTVIGAPGYTTSMRMTKMMTVAIAPKLAKLLNFEIMPSDCVAYFEKIIKDTYQQRLESGTRRNDIIDMMIDEIKNKNEKKNVNENEYDKDAAIDTKGLGTLKEAGYDEESLLVANALLLFMVGFDTTSMGFAIVAHKLACYPELQDKVLNEIDDVIGSNDDVTYDLVQKLKYMDNFINEVYRHNDIMVAHERLCSKDYKVPDTDFIIPKGRYVKIYFAPFLKNPDYFKNPNEFDPDNFLPENKPNKFGVQIFGHGPRNCIGMRYANMTIKICLVYLLRNHKVVQGPRFKKDLEFDPQNPANFKDGVFVKVESR